jgi:glucose/mannose transport system substrate-binding protein
MFRALLKRTALCLWFCLGSACDDPSTANEESVVEIFSWWTGPGEAAALDALLSVHARRFPKAKVINAAARDSTSARALLRNRMEAGEPPDTFQANVGQDLLSWVLYNGVDDAETKLEVLDAERLVGAEWKNVFPEAVLRAAGYADKVYAVPVNIHRINSLFFNISVFEEHGLAPPATLEELYAACVVFQKDGITPIAVGAKEPWTLSILFFENLFVATAGAAYYQQYFTGQAASASDPRMLDALDQALELWRCTNADARDISWDEAVARVHEGRAAMTVMGDWAKGALVQLHGVPGETFGQIPFPGTQGSFIFTADTFPLPRGAPSREAALDLLRTFVSSAGEDAFNPLKGSIPARTDANPAVYDPLGRMTLQDFRKDQLYLALSGLAPGAFSMPVDAALGEMVDQLDPEPARLALEGYYDVLVAAKTLKEPKAR